MGVATRGDLSSCSGCGRLGSKGGARTWRSVAFRTRVTDGRAWNDESKRANVQPFAGGRPMVEVHPAHALINNSTALIVTTLPCISVRTTQKSGLEALDDHHRPDTLIKDYC